MSNQKFYTRTIELLEAQGCRSTKPRDGYPEGCAYRGENNRKCAAGFWISDALYTVHMESISIEALVEQYPDLVAIFSGISMSLVSKMQRFHDEPTHWDDKGISRKGKEYLAAVAQEFSLKPYFKLPYVPAPGDRFRVAGNPTIFTAISPISGVAACGSFSGVDSTRYVLTICASGYGTQFHKESTTFTKIEKATGK